MKMKMKCGEGEWRKKVGQCLISAFFAIKGVMETPLEKQIRCLPVFPSWRMQARNSTTLTSPVL